VKGYLRVGKNEGHKCGEDDSNLIYNVPENCSENTHSLDHTQLGKLVFKQRSGLGSTEVRTC